MMKLLYIHTEVISDQDVADSLIRMFGTIAEYRDVAINVDTLVYMIEEQGIEFVMALKYIPMISILCEAMQVQYISWICLPYDKNIYSYTLLNSCNHLFFADSSLYEKFSSDDFQNVYYLPLGVNVSRIDEILLKRNLKEDQTIDLIMSEDIFDRSELKEYQLLKKSGLKDATLGYLEGCFACQYQLSGIPLMTNRFPEYAWEDLQKQLPIQFSQDSIETLDDAYNSRIFNSVITNSDRDIHFNILADNVHFKKCEIYTNGDHYMCDLANVCNKYNYLRDLPKIAARGKLHLVITDRNWKNGISQIAWDIMASGGAIISNYQRDYKLLFDTTPMLYTDINELMYNAVYLIKHDLKRQSNAIEIQNEIREKHDYSFRLKEMFSKVMK